MRAGKAQRDRAPLEALQKAQAARREKAAAERQALDARQKDERGALAEVQRRERLALKAAYLAEVRRIKEAREAARPTGLAAFLGRVTGVSLIIKKLHQHRDARRFADFVQARAEMKDRQGRIAAELSGRHRLQALDADRSLRALDQLDARERKSLETQATRRERVTQRGGAERMPALTLELRPGGRRAVPHKAMHRHHKRDTAKAEPPLERTAETRPAPQAESLRDTFARAAAARRSESGRGETGGGPGGAVRGGRTRRGAGGGGRKRKASRSI